MKTTKPILLFISRFSLPVLNPFIFEKKSYPKTMFQRALLIDYPFQMITNALDIPLFSRRWLPLRFSYKLSFSFSAPFQFLFLLKLFIWNCAFLFTFFDHLMINSTNKCKQWIVRNALLEKHSNRYSLLAYQVVPIFPCLISAKL